MDYICQSIRQECWTASYTEWLPMTGRVLTSPASSFLAYSHTGILSIAEQPSFTDITQVGNAALQFGGLFRLDIYRVRLSIFGYSGVARDYGVRGLGLLGWLPLTGPAVYIPTLLASQDIL